MTFKEPILLLRSESMVNLSYGTLLLLFATEPQFMLKNRRPRVIEKNLGGP